MIEPHSAQLGASAWAWKLTLVAPRLSVIAGAVPVALPLVVLPLPFAAWPLACPLVAMTVSSWGSVPAGSADTTVALAGVSVGVSAGAAAAAGGDDGVGAVSARDAWDAALSESAGAIGAEPGEDAGTSATIAERSMSPRFAFSSAVRNREPSQRKM